MSNSRNESVIPHLYFFEGSQDLRAEGVIVVVHHVLDLPGPVDDDAFKMLHEVLNGKDKFPRNIREI